MRRAALALARGAAVALCWGVVAACAGGPECHFNSDCRYGTHCAEGVCFAECRYDMDCAHGLVCDPLFGRCTSGTGDGGVPDGPAQDDGPAQEDGSPQEDGPAQDDGSAQEDASAQNDGPPGHYPDPCDQASDCDSNLCLIHPIYLDSHCLPTLCSAITQCQMGDICVQHVPLTLPSCLPSDIGKSCNGTGQCLYSCAYNQLLDLGVCTNPCSMAADCPAGWTCSAYADPPELLCMPPDTTPCSGHGDCVFPVSVTGGVAACVIGTVTPGRCLNTCRTTADCPAGDTCTDLGIKVCVPPTAPETGTGALGDQCGGDGDKCRSGLCLGTTCTERCGVTHAASFCPYPYGCLPVEESPGVWIMVCEAAGTGDIGAACTDESSCRTGLCITDTGPAFCTKFCNDGICPTGYTCQDVGTTADGVPLQACAP
jgi:hypothetical protein